MLDAVPDVVDAPGATPQMRLAFAATCVGIGKRLMKMSVDRATERRLLSFAQADVARAYLDAEARVLYIGTFSKVLFPAMRSLCPFLTI